MENTIVEKNYKDFVNHLSIEFRKRLDDSEGYRDTGKLYQDMFLWSIKSTIIKISSKCQNNIEKHKTILTDIFSTLPLLDDTLFNDLKIIKGYYINKNEKLNKPSYKNLENYCNEKCNNYSRNSKAPIETIDANRLLEHYKNQYKNTYAPQKNNEFKRRSSDLKKCLSEDERIHKIAKNRVNTNKEYYIQYSDKQISNLQKEIDILNKRNKNGNNQIRQYIQNLEQKRNNYTQRKEEIEKETGCAKEVKFKKKLIELAHHYITSSRDNENKNLREKYVNLFILDDYSKFINFEKNDTSIYTLCLGKNPLQMIEERKQEIFRLFDSMTSDYNESGQLKLNL